MKITIELNNQEALAVSAALAQRLETLAAATLDLDEKEDREQITAAIREWRTIEQVKQRLDDSGRLQFVGW